MIGWLIDLIISFVIRQVVKFGKGIDWVLVKADGAVRVAKLVPGDWFDAEAVMVFEKAVDVMEMVLSSGEVIEQIVELIKSKNLQGAIELVKKLIFDVVAPDAEQTPAQLYFALKAWQKPEKIV